MVARSSDAFADGLRRIARDPDDLVRGEVELELGLAADVLAVDEHLWRGRKRAHCTQAAWRRRDLVVFPLAIREELLRLRAEARFDPSAILEVTLQFTYFAPTSVPQAFTSRVRGSAQAVRARRHRDGLR